MCEKPVRVRHEAARTRPSGPVRRQPIDDLEEGNGGGVRALPTGKGLHALGATLVPIRIHPKLCDGAAFQSLTSASILGSPVTRYSPGPLTTNAALALPTNCPPVWFQKSVS